MTPDELAKYGLRVKPLVWDDEILLRGQPGKRPAIAPPDVAQAARVTELIEAAGSTLEYHDNAGQDGSFARLRAALRALLPEGGE